MFFYYLFRQIKRCENENLFKTISILFSMILYVDLFQLLLSDLHIFEIK